MSDTSESEDGSFQEIDMKRASIAEAVEKRNVLALKKLAIEAEGLLDNDLRKEAWPIILGLDLDEKMEVVTDEQMKSHKDYTQVTLDVPRSASRFPASIPAEHLAKLQGSLLNVIMRVLIANPGLYYYQGYHDICVTVLLVVDGDEDLAVRICDGITKRHLSLFMEETMETTLDKLKLIFPTIQSQDEMLCNFLERSTCGVAFCVSWYITWFGHDIRDFQMIARLFDFFLAEEYLMPVYLAAVMVLAHSDSIKGLECGLGETHSYLARITEKLRSRDDLENYIETARKIAAMFPEKLLEKIEKYRLEKLEEQRLLEEKLAIERKLEREELIRWQRSFVGSSVLWMKRSPWKKTLISTVIVISIAVLYQKYRKSYSLDDAVR